ncbi:MAG: AraC family transcriptional regulator [Eubacteriales bacterium]|nr:AraC family transcriptional regulator [Eubacteriales bacterium]
MEAQSLFSLSSSVSSTRIIYTPSPFARSSLIHLQETGTLQALHPHKSERSGLNSCLFFTVLSGSGELVYDGKRYELRTGDCVFIDCRKVYSHETGHVNTDNSGTNNVNSLWSLQWCHFYGPNMNAIYRKYQERGGRPVFQTEQLNNYRTILTELYQIAESADYVRDMRIHEKLSSLLILLMEDAWCGEKASNNTPSTVDIQQVKEYLDLNYAQIITLDDLASRFFINKYYLLKLFKERYGVTINAYLNQVRVTYVKQQLRFTDKTVECLAIELGMEPNYLSRLFKKVEGVSPSEYRKKWRGN